MLAILVVPVALLALLIGFMPLRQRPLDLQRSGGGSGGVLLVLAVMLIIIATL